MNVNVSAEPRTADTEVGAIRATLQVAERPSEISAVVSPSAEAAPDAAAPARPRGARPKAKGARKTAAKGKKKAAGARTTARKGGRAKKAKA